MMVLVKLKMSEVRNECIDPWRFICVNKLKSLTERHSSSLMCC